MFLSASREVWTDDTQLGHSQVTPKKRHHVEFISFTIHCQGFSRQMYAEPKKVLQKGPNLQGFKKLSIDYFRQKCHKTNTGQLSSPLRQTAIAEVVLCDSTKR